MMLYDKGYYDYDFERIEKEAKWEQTILSQEELAGKLSMFGIGKKKPEPMSLEEIQEHVIKQMEEQ